jgi:glycosyltransferase involved in cell wall biosynthesis
MLLNEIPTDDRLTGAEMFQGSIALAGQFDPRTVASYLPPDVAAPIAHLKSSPGVPMHSLAKALADRSISTVLIGGVRRCEAIDVKHHPLSVSIYPKGGGLSFVLNGMTRERAAVLNLLRQTQPTIVHAHWTFEAARAVGDWPGPKVLTVHDAAWEYARLGFSASPFNLAYTARWLYNTAQVLSRFSHIIAVSPFVETYLRLKHRYRGEIRVIPNIVPSPATDSSVAETYPKSGTLTFGCYGEPGGIKNVSAAIEAFRRLPSSFSQARLFVFGNHWDKARRPQDARIIFKGALPHAEFLRSQACEIDIWVHPARIEAHPLSICEAIQAGCPVIAGAASGGVAWTLDYGRAGVLVDVDDHDALMRAMMDLAADPVKSQQIVAAGRRFISEQFNAQRVVDLHLQYYRDIVSSRA